MINNLFVFHGVDHKVGTTMISQSAAEIIANGNKNLKVLFLSLNGRESTEYVKEAPITIDSIKMHIDNKIINEKDLLKRCKIADNFYMMAGISNEVEERFYFPDMSKYLLETVSPEFDLIIADSGNEIDNGLAIGALADAKDTFLVLTQQESIIRRFERLKNIYMEMGFNISAYIINKFYDLDPYSLDYMADRIQVDKDRFIKVESTGFSRQAEMDYKTLVEYKNEKYNRDILEISNCILMKAGLPKINKQRKNLWKSFT